MAEYLPVSEGGNHDRLEAELSSFPPVPPSPGLAQQIGRQLADEPARPLRVGAARRWLLAGLAAAACGTLAAVLWREGDGGMTRPPEVVVTPPVGTVPNTAGPAEVPPPSRAAYQQALSRSPEALDALLDSHAARLFPSTGSHVSPRSDTQLSTITGDAL